MRDPEKGGGKEKGKRGEIGGRGRKRKESFTVGNDLLFLGAYKASGKYAKRSNPPPSSSCFLGGGRGCLVYDTEEPSSLPLSTRARAMNNAWKGIFLRVVLASRGET